MCTTMIAKEREGQVELAVMQLGGKTVLERERAGTQLSRLLSGNRLIRAVHSFIRLWNRMLSLYVY